MKNLSGLALLVALFASIIGVPDVRATPASCLASPSCTLDGETFTTTGGTSSDGLTFLASFTTSSQSNTSIAKLVTDYLGLLGDSVTYLGRQNGTGLIDGDNVSTTAQSGGLTGTWTFTPGTTGDVAAFVAIHAGQSNELFAIDTPGLSGTWATENGHRLSNFDLFGEQLELSGGQAAIPEPASIALLAAGLAGLGITGRRRRQSQA